MDALQHGEMTLVLEHGWCGHAGQLAQGDFAEGGRKIHAADQLADVEQVELGLPLQHRIDLIEQAVAVERHAHVQGDGLANGQGNVSWTAGAWKFEDLRRDRGGAGLFGGRGYHLPHLCFD